jgi:hypothetical protein
VIYAMMIEAKQHILLVVLLSNEFVSLLRRDSGVDIVSYVI